MAELNKKLEKEVKKDVEKEVKKEVEGKLGKKLDKKTEGKLKKDIDEEVKKRLPDRLKDIYEAATPGKLFEKTKASTQAFKKEFKKHAIVAITAAFAFSIALSWKTPIQNTVDGIVKALRLESLTSKAVLIEYATAIIITIIAVLALMWVSRWSSKEKG
jgi:hypothetical protein